MSVAYMIHIKSDVFVWAENRVWAVDVREFQYINTLEQWMR